MTSRLLAVVLLGVLVTLVSSKIILSNRIVILEYPNSWPAPHYNFEKNPLTENGIELGRKLFYDPILSSDSTISCSSCHSPFSAFTHIDHQLSHGVNDSIGFRNSPVLVNLAWGNQFMWDGSSNHLDVQALAPITSPSEMNESLVNVIAKLSRSEYYKRLFAEAYKNKEISGENLMKALSQFELTLISKDSKYDEVLANEGKFTHQEANGYKLFKINCASCHQEPLFTNHTFQNNGLNVDPTLNDFGRYRITKNNEDSLMFKVPTLRNVEFSHPYMHDGRYSSLREVLNHYSNNEKLKIQLSSNEKVDIIAFLLTLSDKSFLFNREFGFPFEEKNKESEGKQE